MDLLFGKIILFPWVKVVNIYNGMPYIIFRADWIHHNLFRLFRSNIRVRKCAVTSRITMNKKYQNQILFLLSAGFFNVLPGLTVCCLCFIIRNKKRLKISIRMLFPCTFCRLLPTEVSLLRSVVIKILPSGCTYIRTVLVNDWPKANEEFESKLRRCTWQSESKFSMLHMLDHRHS